MLQSDSLAEQNGKSFDFNGIHWQLNALAFLSLRDSARETERSPRALKMLTYIAKSGGVTFFYHHIYTLFSFAKH